VVIFVMTAESSVRNGPPLTVTRDKSIIVLLISQQAFVDAT
jgi:hypothetical protein